MTCVIICEHQNIYYDFITVGNFNNISNNNMTEDNIIIYQLVEN